MKQLWRKIWFMDDDDNTPQGKLARGTFYLFYAFLGFMFLFGAVVPTIDYACGGCWQEARNRHKPQQPDCWPWWQCNGSKETNHPNCKCWDGK